MTLPRLWAFLAFALPALAALLASLSAVDLAYHLRAGGEILSSRAIPTVDNWTFTAAGTPWTDQQWGAQVVLAAVHRLGGWTGIALLRAGLVAFTFGCVFEIGRRHGLGVRQAAWLALAAFVVSAPALALRPQLMGMALFALVLLLVTDRHNHPPRLWAVPLIVLVWANIHGSFFLGPLVLGLAWLADIQDRREQPHRPLIVGVVSALVACITPFGPAVWAYAVGLTTNPEVTRRITEWQPTTLRDPAGILFFGSAIAVVILLARRGRTVPWPVLAWLGIFFLIGAFALRGVAWWPLGAATAVAVLLSRPGLVGDREVQVATHGSSTSRRLNAALAGLLILAGVLLLPAWRPQEPGLDAPSGVLSDAPLAITAELRQIVVPGDRLFNPQPWGSWFEFALPDVPVAIDSRVEFFPVEVWDAYDSVVSGRDGWAAQLKAWDTTIVVVMAGEVGLAERLAGTGWQTVFTDPEGSILLAPDR